MPSSILLQPLKNIFPNRLFRIPLYQRGFTWEKEQIDDLIQDIRLLPEGHNHFMGMLVLQPAYEMDDDQIKPEKLSIRTRDYDIVDVIDGQQRLTSLTLFLQAICLKLESLGQEEAAWEIRSDLILISNPVEPYARILMNPKVQDYFLNEILLHKRGLKGPQVRTERLLRDALSTFQTHLNDHAPDVPSLLALHNKLKEKLMFIEYQVEDKLDAQLIFEALNDRGKQLTHLELVKNYLVYLASRMEPEYSISLRRKIDDTWGEIFMRLDEVTEEKSNEHEDRLLRVHWLMTKNPDPSRWLQSRTVKEHFHPEQDSITLFKEISIYLDTLDLCAIAYRNIFRPDHPDAQVKYLKEKDNIISLGERLVRLGARASLLPLLIAVQMDPDAPGDFYTQVLDLAEKFYFRVYEWADYRSDTGQSALFRIAYEYYHDQDQEKLLRELANLLLNYCSDDRFLEIGRSQTRNWYDWSGIYYFLWEYQVALAKGKGFPMRWENLRDKAKERTIEHILPQTPTDPYWLKRFPDKTSQDRWTNDLGNLTLTYDNSELQNYSFLNKIGKPGQSNRYITSPLAIENALANPDKYPEWSPTQIQARHEEILLWAIQRWKVQEPPPIPAEIPETMERMLDLTDKSGYGEAFRRMHDVTTQLRLSPRVRKNIQYCPPFDGTLSVMTVQVNPNGIWVYFRLHNFAKYGGVTMEQVNEFLPYANRQRKFIAASEIDQLTMGLERLYYQVKDLL